MTQETREFPSDAVAALERGSKIEAIKCVRISQGVGLKDAKEIVEAYIDSNPEIKHKMASANAASAAGGLRWLLMMAAAGVAAYYLIMSGKL